MTSNYYNGVVQRAIEKLNNNRSTNY